jgi:hypothetical protein
VVKVIVSAVVVVKLMSWAVPVTVTISPGPYTVVDTVVVEVNNATVVVQVVEVIVVTALVVTSDAISRVLVPKNVKILVKFCVDTVVVVELTIVWVVVPTVVVVALVVVVVEFEAV